MTRLFPVPVPGQRAAEEFDSVLGGRATQDVAERYAQLVATVQVLSDQPVITPRAEFAADLRSRLMLAAETELLPAPPVARRAPASRSQRNRRLGSAAAALVIVGGSAGMAAAASGALPGDSLYPIKRGIEQVTTAAHVGDASKGSALLGQASQRLDEIDALTSADSPNADLVAATADAFRAQANAGADKLFTAYQTDSNGDDIAKVRDFTAANMSQLASMPSADPATLGSLRDAADTLAEIDQQAVTLCASCGGGATLAPPGVLASGAGAASVQDLIAAPITEASRELRVAIAAQQAAAKAQLGGLSHAAEGAAASKLGEGSSGGTGTLASSVPRSDKLIPGVTSTAPTAVRNLVGGLTSAVTGEGGVGGDADLADAASNAGKTVDKTVVGLTKGVGDTLGGLTNPLQPKK